MYKVPPSIFCFDLAQRQLTKSKHLIRYQIFQGLKNPQHKFAFHEDGGGLASNAINHGKKITRMKNIGSSLLMQNLFVNLLVFQDVKISLKLKKAGRVT